MTSRSNLLTALLLVSFLVSHAAAEHNWPRWRGPDGSGHSSETNLPVSWNNDNVVWRASLKGLGQSSPTIWGEKIFLTSALDKGKKRIVFCLDRNTGKTLWEQTAWTGEPERVHKMNKWSSATCATDGEHVVAFFGVGGIHCYNLAGKPLWSRDLGAFAGPWGTAASPVIVGDVVIQNCDSDEEAFLIGLNIKTGETLWRTPRENIRGWSSPILAKAAGRQELVINGHYGVNAYNPATGKELWFCQVPGGRGTPTIAKSSELLVAVPGRSGEVVAIRGGGKGDVSQSHALWRTERRGGRDLPSPIIVGDYLLVVSMRPGLATCYETSTGKQLWKERIGGQFTSSPIAAGGLVYILDESGEVIVIRPGAKLEIVARNKIEHGDSEIFRASPTPSDGQIFIRSDQVIYCVGQRK